ncbi:MAG: magnesium transporter [bacterium]
MAELIKKGQLFLKETIAKILENEDWDELELVLRDYFLQDIAHVMKYFPLEQNESLLKYLGSEKAGILLRETDRFTRAELIARIDENFLLAILDTLPSDDAADILGRLPREQTARLLKLMEHKRAVETQRLLQFHPDTAGGIMTQNYIAIQEDLSLEQAVDEVRKQSQDFLAPRIYIVDDNNILKGYVPTGRLLMKDTNIPVKEVMISRLIKVKTDMDQEEVAQIVTRFDLFTVPVVDNLDRLVGVITVDDVMDVIHREATEDAFKLSGTDINELEERSAVRIARIRVPWLFATIIGELVASFTIGYLTVGMEKLVPLFVFVPVIMALGGNVGSQTATVIVRGLAIGQVTAKDLIFVLFKEVRVGVILGIVLGVVMGLLAYVRFVGTYGDIAMIVAISMFCVLMLGVSVGTFLPIFFKRLNVDPAVATAPFVSVTLDNFGIAIYFLLAKIIL